MKKTTKIFLTCAAMVALSACGGGSDGSAQNVSSFTVSSPAFDTGVIPLKYTQYGSNVRPAITVGKLPEGTTTLAIVMDDETPPCGTGSNACLHANVFNIPVSTNANENAVSEGWGEFDSTSEIVYGTVLGHTGYAGPKPPNGLHTYNLDVYALNESMPTIAKADTPMTRSEFKSKYQAHILGTGRLTATFTTP